MPESNIKAALIRFNGAIKSADGAALSVALTEIETLLGAHRDELHPQLRHYLEGRSYAKALAWLGVDDSAAARPSSPPGGCGGGHA
jgi:predicted component of type VI protein secretion system